MARRPRAALARPPPLPLLAEPAEALLPRAQPLAGARLVPPRRHARAPRAAAGRDPARPGRARLEAGLAPIDARGVGVPPRARAAARDPRHARPRAAPPPRARPRARRRVHRRDPLP